MPMTAGTSNFERGQNPPGSRPVIPLFLMGSCGTFR